MTFFTDRSNLVFVYDTVRTQFVEIYWLSWSCKASTDLGFTPTLSTFCIVLQYLCAEHSERCSVNWVQPTKIYKSRQLSWSVWHHPTGSVHTVSSLFTQESEAAVLPGHVRHAPVHALLGTDLILNSWALINWYIFIEAFFHYREGYCWQPCFEIQAGHDIHDHSCSTGPNGR